MGRLVAEAPVQQIQIAMAYKFRLPHLLPIMIVATVVNVGVVIGYKIYTEGNLEPLPTLGTVKPFSLVSQTGAPFGLSDLAGKIWVADFMFTSCAGPCPLMGRRFAGLQRHFGGQPNFQLISFSVDPDTDTPEVLAAYASALGADPLRWRFLTGEYEQIHAVAAESFHLGSTANALHHSTYFTLVDGEGAIRGYFDSTDPHALEDLTAQARQLLNLP